MKKIIVLLCGLVLSANVWSQSSADIYNPKVPVTWLGLDCTQLKIIGSASQWGSKSFISASEVKNKYFPGWNHLFIDEQKKYDVAGVVKRKTINYALQITEDANNNTDTNAIFTPNDGDYQLLTKEKIAELVSAYNFEGKPGIGLMIFMEGLSKSAEEGCGWLTFVNMDTKTVLFTKRYRGKSGGFGFRNYWAKSIRDILSAYYNDPKAVKG